MALVINSQYSQQLREQRLGYIAISLDPFADGAGIPNVTAGSVCEIGDSLYTIDADTTIDGNGSLAIAGDGTYYIFFDPTDNDIICDSSPGTWDDEKQGYYATVGGHVCRCVGSLVKSGSNYNQKTILINKEQGIINTGINLGGNSANADRILRFATDASLQWDESEDEFIFNKNVRCQNAFYRDTSGRVRTVTPQQNTVFDAISPAIPNVGDEIPVTGYMFEVPILTYAHRTSTSVITFYGMDGASFVTYAVTDGSHTLLSGNISIAW